MNDTIRDSDATLLRSAEHRLPRTSCVEIRVSPTVTVA